MNLNSRPPERLPSRSPGELFCDSTSFTPIVPYFLRRPVSTREKQVHFWELGNTNVLSNSVDGQEALTNDALRRVGMRPALRRQKHFREGRPCKA